jgi:hypothetical protein
MQNNFCTSTMVQFHHLSSVVDCAIAIVFINLRGEIEAKIALIFDRVLNDDWSRVIDLETHLKQRTLEKNKSSYPLAEHDSLCELVEVLDRKVNVQRLGHRDHRRHRLNQSSLFGKKWDKSLNFELNFECDANILILCPKF